MENISGSTLIDDAGNYNATITGATVASGFTGNALQFVRSTANNANDTLDTTYKLPLSGDFSLNFKLYIATLPSDEQAVVNQYLLGDAGRTILRISPSGKIGKIDLFVGGSSTAGFSLTSAVWMNIFVGRVSGDFHLSLNGGTDQVLNVASDIADTEMLVGKIFTTSWIAGFSGLIDEFYVYQRYLDASERKRLEN
jgi:hypothetical protein